MLILIDQQPTEVDLPEGDFEAAAIAIVKYCAEAGRVVSGLEVDGVGRPVDDPAALRSIDRDTVQTVSVQTESIQESAKEILRSLADNIPKLIDAFSKVNEDLQSRDTAGAFERIEEAGGFWIEIVEACLTTVRALGTDFDSVEVSSPSSGGTPQTGTEVLAHINELLVETQNAFENEDNLEIGDIFEYDLPPLLRSFQQILYSLADR